MNDYNYMHPSGKTVMRLSTYITSTILLLILTTLYIVNTLWLKWLESDTMIWIIAVGLIIILINLLIGVVIIHVYRYKIFRYKLKENEIMIRNGLWFVSVVNIPLFRIQNVDTHEGILMRKYKLASLTLSTAGGNTEIKLINKDTATALKYKIKNVNTINEPFNDENLLEEHQQDD